MKSLHIIDRLPSTLRESVIEELARGGLWTAYSLETRTGLKAIDSPYEPRGEAQRNLMKSGCKSDLPTLLLGSGSGYFSRVIAEERFAPALCVTRSRALLKANEKRLHSRFPEGDEDVSIVADDDPGRIWREDILPFLIQHPDCTIVRHPREPRAFPGFYGALDLYIARWQSGKTDLSPTSNIRRVLFIGAEALFEKELVAEITRRDIHVERIPQSDIQRLTAKSALELLETHRPDLVLSTNCRGSDEVGILPEACEQSGVCWATWLLDDPRYLLKPEEIEGAGRQRIGFCWDLNGIDGWQRAGFQNAHILPLATDDTLFKPQPGFDDLTGRIVFIGSPRFASGRGFFAGLDTSDIAHKVTRALEPEILRLRRPPSHERINELLSTLDPDASLDREARRRLPAFATQQANLAYRVHYLNVLAELKPIVFGNGWEGLLDDRIELRPGLDFYSELPKLYSTDAVHVSLTNLQMRSHPNQRPFDIGACRRAVLNDDLTSLSEIFGDELSSEMTFNSEADLLDKSSALVSDPSKRKHLGERLRGVILSRHTIRHRVDRMIEVCEKHM
jgi:hypothetical protein